VYNRDHREYDVAASSSGTTTSTRTTLDDIYWAGLWAGFKAGPVKLGVDAIYSFGKQKAVSGGADKDYNGYLLRVDGSMDMGGPKFDFMSVYVSGDNDSTDDKINNFAYADSNARYSAVGGIQPGPNLLYWSNGIAVEEYVQKYLPTSGDDSGYSLGRWFTMVGATIPVDKLKLVAKYWHLQTTENFPTASNYRNKNMGHEVDLEAHYQLTPNLTVSAEADYLIAGDYFKTSSTMEPDNAWKAAWAIKLVF
jgi:predicted porin